jgi:hypothetical protein
MRIALRADPFSLLVCWAQEAALQLFLQTVPTAAVGRLLRALCHLMTLGGAAELARTMGARAMRVVLGGGARGIGEQLMGNASHPCPSPVPARLQAISQLEPMSSKVHACRLPHDSFRYHQTRRSANAAL